MDSIRATAVNRAFGTDELPGVAHDFAAIPAALIDTELSRIAKSKPFRQSRRHQQLLRHLVTQSVAGNLNALKEPVLAMEVFERPIHAFDPARDTIVRVEARRLRQRLARYYGDEGMDALLEIRLPVGSYVPTLRRRDAANEALSRGARDLVERGEYFLRMPLSHASLEQARARFDAALRESPGYVPALVGLARSWLNLATGWYHDPRPAAEHAAEALGRALESDPGNAVAHALLGAVKHQFEYDWEGASRHFERAVTLAAHNAFVHSAYGCHLLARGDFALADRELALARHLDPQYINTRIHMVNLRIAQHRLADADAELDALRDIAPDSVPAWGMAGLLCMVRGEARHAIACYERAAVLAPDYPLCLAALAGAQGLAGEQAAAAATLARMHAQFGERPVSPYVLAIVATRCGRQDEAFVLLARAIEQRDPNVMLLAVDPSFATLHADARWAPLCARRVAAAED